MKNLKLGTSPISGIIYAGKVIKGMWKGEKKDVTDDAANVVFEHLMFEAKKAKQETFGYTYEGLGTITIDLSNKSKRS